MFSYGGEDMDFSYNQKKRRYGYDGYVFGYAYDYSEKGSEDSNYDNDGHYAEEGESEHGDQWGDGNWFVVDDSESLRIWCTEDGTKVSKYDAHRFYEVEFNELASLDPNANAMENIKSRAFWRKASHTDLMGYTGNEGPYKDEVYHRYALFIIPAIAE
jgi:hypothetical protein